MSELTRKRQSWLLLSAVVCILLSTKVITITKGTLGVVEVSLESQSVLGFVALWFCVYFLVTFLLSVLQDIQAHECRTTAETIEAALLSLHEKQRIEQIAEEHDTYVGRINEIISEIARLQNISIDQLLSESDGSDSQARLERTEQWRGQIEHLTEQLKVLSKEKTDSFVRSGANVVVVSNQMRDATVWGTRLKLGRNILEVVFPSVLAVYGIMSVYWFH